MRKRGVEALASAQSEDIVDMLSLFSECQFHIRWSMYAKDAEYPDDRLVPFSFVRNFILNNFFYQLDIQIYPPNAEISQQNIDYYEEYADSVLVGVFLYHDCGYIDVYVKDETRLQKLYDKLAVLNAKNLEIKTDENDGRTRLNVY